jgi:enoyl-CoA hydratase
MEILMPVLIKTDGPMGPTRMILSKPVIAAIAGYAVAGGLELALWCDLRLMEEDAVLGVFCRRWGVPLIDGGTVRLPRLIGLSRALDLILTGRPVEAEEALQMGLVNRVVPQGNARQAAL